MHHLEDKGLDVIYWNVDNHTDGILIWTKNDWHEFNYLDRIYPYFYRIAGYYAVYYVRTSKQVSTDEVITIIKRQRRGIQRIELGR